MNSLTFLLLRQSKNRLLELKTKPSKLIIYLVAIGFLVFMVIQAMRMEMAVDAVDANVFKGILAGFFMFSFVVSLIPAFTKGASLFEMPDANFLFVAPLRPRTILLYGLVKTVKAILFGSWFMVFQIQWMRASFGVGLGGVLLATLGYVLLTIICQVLNLCIYAFTNGSPQRKLIAKLVIAAMFIPAAFVFLMGFASGDGPMYGLQGLIASPVLDSTPIIGWAAAGISALLLGEMLTGVFFIGLLLVAGIAFFGAVYFGNPDYYEDVLGATETAFEATRAASEDAASAMSNLSGSNKTIKIKGTGINKGAGASTFFYKHVRESFRANRLGLWGTFSLLMVAGAIIWSFWARPGSGYAYAFNPETHLLSMLITLMSLKMFTIATGRGLLETYNHYIYLVPNPPFKKWVWANMETMFKVAVESFVIFTAAGIIVGAPLWTTVAAMAAFVLFAFFMLGITLATMRITETNLNTMLLLTVYFATVLIPLAPGAIGAIIVASMAPEALAFTLGIATLSAWMLLLGAGCFAISKGMLHNCDLPVVKEGQVL
ncbi:MAG: putative ABC exporter domain-containing protein [Defluviitaleaceae bacterium]|nr:putative ABC exporter domain-containing protein [Defluviitaleaceae bacterium]